MLQPDRPLPLYRINLTLILYQNFNIEDLAITLSDQSLKALVILFV